MISSQKMRAGKEEYYLNLSRNKSRTQNKEQTGKWQGEGAKRLELGEFVLETEFRNLYNGYSPDGKKVLVNTNNLRHFDRLCGVDFTYSPAKSVSVFYALGSKEVQQEIQLAVSEAVQSGLTVFENNAYSRRGRNARDFDKAGLVVAMLEDTTSRANDVQLHIHLLVMNIGVRTDRSTGTIDPIYLQKVKHTADAIINADLSFKLEERLGVRIERKQSWFEVGGIPREAIELFSKRKNMIDARLNELGFSSYKSAKIAALSTRFPKQNIPLDELKRIWKLEGQEIGITEHEINNLLGHTFTRNTEQEITAILQETNKALSVFKTFNEHDLTYRIALEAIGRGFGANEILRISEDYLQSKAIIPLGSPRGFPLYSRANEGSQQLIITQSSKYLELLREYAEQGRLIVSDSRAETRKSIFSVWQQNGGLKNPELHLAVAGTLQEVSLMNVRFQELRFIAGALPENPFIGIKDQICFENERVYFLRRSFWHGLASNEFGTVIGIDNQSSSITVLLDTDDKQITVPLKLKAKEEGVLSNSVSLGYCVTPQQAEKSFITKPQSIYILPPERINKTHLNYLGSVSTNDKAYVFTSRSEAGDELMKLAQKTLEEKTKENEKSTSNEQDREYVLEINMKI